MISLYLLFMALSTNLTVIEHEHVNTLSPLRVGQWTTRIPKGVKVKKLNPSMLQISRNKSGVVLWRMQFSLGSERAKSRDEEKNLVWKYQEGLIRYLTSSRKFQITKPASILIEGQFLRFSLRYNLIKPKSLSFLQNDLFVAGSPLEVISAAKHPTLHAEQRTILENIKVNRQFATTKR